MASTILFTKAAAQLPHSQLEISLKTIHEHVYQRRKMIEALIQAKPEAVDHILKNAIGCLVTVDEHERLRPFGQEYGWDRYRRAGIAVMDTSVDPAIAVNFQAYFTSKDGGCGTAGGDGVLERAFITKRPVLSDAAS
jgi:hypothetical protein